MFSSFKTFARSLLELMRLSRNMALLTGGQSRKPNKVFHAEVPEHLLAVTLVSAIRKHEDRNVFQTIPDLCRILVWRFRKNRLHGGQATIPFDHDKLIVHL